MKEILIASNNSNKIREIKQILADTDARVISLEEAGITIEPNETGRTFSQNALIKARAAYEVSNIPVIADDSGLSVDALDGEPGVRSRRYSGQDATDLKNNNAVCRKLREKGLDSSKALFICSIAYIDENGDEHLFEGECEGIFILEPRGKNGFGYDPHFFVKEYETTMAEIDEFSKNSISHRGKALAALAEYLKGGTR